MGDRATRNLFCRNRGKKKTIKERTRKTQIYRSIFPSICDANTGAKIVSARDRKSRVVSLGRRPTSRGSHSSDRRIGDDDDELDVDKTHRRSSSNAVARRIDDMKRRKCAPHYRLRIDGELLERNRHRYGGNYSDGTKRANRAISVPSMLSRDLPIDCDEDDDHATVPLPMATTKEDMTAIVMASSTSAPCADIFRRLPESCASASSDPRFASSNATIDRNEVDECKSCIPIDAILPPPKFRPHTGVVTDDDDDAERKCVVAAEYDQAVSFSKDEIECFVADPADALSISSPLEILASQRDRFLDLASWTCVRATKIGSRPEQQDRARMSTVRFSSDPSDEMLLAVVCDGHGNGSWPNGATAAKTTVNTLFGMVNEMRFDGAKLDAANVGAISRFLKVAIDRAHRQVSSLAWSFDATAGDSGTTVCAAAVPRLSSKASIVVSNVGDSQAMLLGAKGNIKLFTAPHRPATDQSPDIRRDRCRISSAGRICESDGMRSGSLALSRALGHTHFALDCGVLPRPTVYVEPLETDDALVLASDGFWDYYMRTSDAQSELKDYVGRLDAVGAVANATAKMGDHADNTTAIIAHFTVKTVRSILCAE